MLPPYIKRRGFLRAMGASAAVFLPWLRDVRADTELERCKRAVFFFGMQGVRYDAWKPSGGRTDFVLSPVLAPLEPVREHINIINGLNISDGLGGHGGLYGCLTGRRGRVNQTPPAEGVSIDNFLARRVYDDQLPPAADLLIAGVATSPGHGYGTPSFNENGAAVPAMNNPRDVFDRVFGGFVPVDGEDAEAAFQRIRREKLSVLDFVNSDVGSMRPYLSGSERAKIDEYMDRVRDVERQLQHEIDNGPPQGCVPPEEPAQGLDYAGHDADILEMGKLHMDLIVAALACGRTNVATLVWENGNGRGASFPFLNGGQLNKFGDIAHHDIAHLGSTGDAGLSTSQLDAMKSRIDAWYMEQLAYLIQQLADAGLLDASVVLAARQMGGSQSTSDVHSTALAPFVLAGQGGGYFRTGQFLNYAQTEDRSDAVDQNPSQTGLLAMICRAMGVDVDVFGDPGYRTESFSELRA